MKRRPRDERDLLNLPKPALDPRIEERTTINAQGSSGELERIGRAWEGMDGKKYLGSVAIHFYKSASILNPEVITAAHSTDLRFIGEHAMAIGLAEAGRAIMKRYGRTPPRKTTDKDTIETEHNVAEAHKA